MSDLTVTSRTRTSGSVYWDMRGNDGLWRGEWWLSYDGETNVWMAWDGLSQVPDMTATLKAALSDEDRAFVLAYAIEHREGKG